MLIEDKIFRLEIKDGLLNRVIVEVIMLLFLCFFLNYNFYMVMWSGLDDSYISSSLDDGRGIFEFRNLNIL